jgi:hypothetical protein
MSVLAQNQTVPVNSKLDTGSSRFLTVGLLRAIAHFAENHGWGLFAAMSLACGWGSMKALVTRHLDHDELFTLYIAQAPTLSRLFKLTHTVDLHPPLSYLLVRASFAIFGVSSWSCRLPFLLAFFAASALLFSFVSRLLSPLYGIIATLILWSTPLTYLATEARPYPLLLCFTALLLVSWHQAAEADNPSRRRWALATVTVSGFGLLLSHVLGVLAYGAFLAAELLRFWIRRKPYWRLWTALLIPLVSVFIYLPLLHNRSTMMFAEELRVTPLRLVSFYWESIRYLVTPLALIALLALFWPLLRKQTPANPPANRRAIHAPLGFLLACLSVVPIAIGILFSRNGTAYFDRYGVVWLVPLTIVPALVLGYCTQQNRLAGTVTALLLATVLFFNTSGKPWLIERVANLIPAKTTARFLYVFALPPIITVHYPPIPSYLQAEFATAPAVSHLDSVAPELPLVANTGLTFIEVDRQETAPVAQRLYLLTDEDAASTIAHDNVFAHYEQVKEAFPVIRGKVEPYCTFISAHSRFVVVGAYNNPQGWLLRKLDRDGADLRVIGTCNAYSEDCQIYEVSVRRKQCQNPSEPLKPSSSEARATAP